MILDFIQVGPESNEKHPYKKRHCHREGHVETEAETGVLQPQVGNTWSHQKLETARKDSPLEPCEGAQACRHYGERINLYCFKAECLKERSLWSCVSAATGN